MANEGCAMQPRQLLPPEAFISLEELMAEDAHLEGLRILCVSYPWLEVCAGAHPTLAAAPKGALFTPCCPHQRLRDTSHRLVL
eukprot:6280463-Prymnesium_polylepis.1